MLTNFTNVTFPPTIDPTIASPTPTQSTFVPTILSTKLPTLKPVISSTHQPSLSWSYTQFPSFPPSIAPSSSSFFNIWFILFIILLSVSAICVTCLCYKYAVFRYQNLNDRSSFREWMNDPDHNEHDDVDDVWDVADDDDNVHMFSRLPMSNSSGNYARGGNRGTRLRGDEIYGARTHDDNSTTNLKNSNSSRRDDDETISFA